MKLMKLKMDTVFYSWRAVMNLTVPAGTVVQFTNFGSIAWLQFEDMRRGILSSNIEFFIEELEDESSSV